jgi:hypothetical protein
MLKATPSIAALQRSALVVLTPTLKICPRRYGLLIGDRSPKSHGVKMTWFAPGGDLVISLFIIRYISDVDIPHRGGA